MPGHRMRGTRRRLSSRRCLALLGAFALISADVLAPAVAQAPAPSFEFAIPKSVFISEAGEAPFNIRLKAGGKVTQETWFEAVARPDTITFSAGKLKDGVWQIPVADAAGLRLIVPADAEGDGFVYVMLVDKGLIVAVATANLFISPMNGLRPADAKATLPPSATPAAPAGRIPATTDTKTEKGQIAAVQPKDAPAPTEREATRAPASAAKSVVKSADAPSAPQVAATPAPPTPPLAPEPVLAPTDRAPTQSQAPAPEPPMPPAPQSATQSATATTTDATAADAAKAPSSVAASPAPQIEAPARQVASAPSPQSSLPTGTIAATPQQTTPPPSTPAAIAVQPPPIAVDHARAPPTAPLPPAPSAPPVVEKRPEPAPPTPAAPAPVAPVDAARAAPVTAPVAVAAVTASVPPALEPPQSLPPPPPVAEANPRLQRLLALGERNLADGNISIARQYFEAAAELGSAMAAFKLAETNDPIELEKAQVVGLKIDTAEAVRWYRKAAEFGMTEATQRIERLKSRQ